MTLQLGVFTDVFVNAPVASPDSVAEQQHVLAQVRGIWLHSIKNSLKPSRQTTTDVLNCSR